MIEYRFDEEIKYATHYASKLDDKVALEILERGDVRSSTEAVSLCTFFWKMVDSSIEDEKKEVRLPWSEGAEFWNEKLMYSFSGYLEKSGYEAEWEKLVDEQ